MIKKLCVALLSVALLAGCNDTSPELVAEREAAKQYASVNLLLPEHGRVVERLGNKFYTVAIPVEGKERLFLANIQGTTHGYKNLQLTLVR